MQEVYGKQKASYIYELPITLLGHTPTNKLTITDKKYKE